MVPCTAKNAVVILAPHSMITDMGDVVILPVITRLDTPPERVIAALSENEFDEIVVIGFLKNGEEYFASNKSDGGAILWHLERAKKKLMDIADQDK